MPLTLEEVKAKAQSKHDWTYADYALLPPELRCEIYDGNLTMSPSPIPLHQRVIFNVAKFIEGWTEPRALGEVFISPVDVALTPTRVVIPDLLFVSAKHAFRVKENGIEGPPDLVVEVLSPTSLRHDRTVKFRYYEAAGVSEYWIVDPAGKTVEIYHLATEGELAGCYDLLYDPERPDHRWSAVLTGLAFAQNDLFISR